MADENKQIPIGTPDDSILKSPARMFDALLRVNNMKFESCTPGMVVEYDRNTHMAFVQPLVNILSPSGEQLVRQPLYIPVRRIQHGEFLMDFPLYKGDTGWIIGADRDTENALSYNTGTTTSDGTTNKGPQRPNTKIIHKYRFGFFIPDRWGNLYLDKTENISVDDLADKSDYTGKAVIRSMNGKTRIIITKDGDVEISLNGEGANNNLVINANMTVNGNIVTTGDVTTNGNMTTNGNVTIDGDVSASGDASINGDVSSGKSLSSVLGITAGGNISTSGNVSAQGDVSASVKDNEAVSLISHVHPYKHNHETNVGGTNYPTIDSSLNPITTDVPVLVDQLHNSEYTVSITVTFPSASARYFYNVLSDGMPPQADGQPGTTTDRGNVSSRSITITGKMVENIGGVYIKKPYMRIGFYAHAASSTNYMYTGGGGVNTISISGTNVSQTHQNYSTDNAELRYLAFDFSQYLNKATISNISITVTLYATSSNHVTPHTATIISPDTHKLTSIITVS